MPPNTQLQPDILVYPARYPIDSKWEDIDEHWLAVQVLSRSSRVYDREIKRDAYIALGVQEVWLVDRWSKVVEVTRVRGPGASWTTSCTGAYQRSWRRSRFRSRTSLRASDACQDGKGLSAICPHRSIDI